MTHVPKPSLFTHEQLMELNRSALPPCLSLYQPTHRHFPQNPQDPIRFRNLVKELSTSLRKLYPVAALAPLLRPFEELVDDRAFWNHTLDGLAVFAGRGFFRAYRLSQSFRELAVVADSFHTKPLRRYLQSTDRYHVLALSLGMPRLYEGNRFALDELALLPEALQELPNAAQPEPADATHAPEIDAAHYFRCVDRMILKHYSRRAELPLIVAALPEHHARFRQVSRNPFLVPDGIRTHPDALTPETLRALAWQVMAPQQEARWEALRVDLEHARAKGLGSDDLECIAMAAVRGRIATLLIESDRVLAGALDATSGRFKRFELSHPHVDDLLDDLGELVAKTGGQVLVMPAQYMTTQTGVAATFRY